MFDKIYLIPSYKCNLNCPHCDIHKNKEILNEDNFFDTLKNIESNEIILFGGEPLLNKNILIKCLESNKITSISTNLLLFNEEYAKLFLKYKLSIATSWNPNRFSELEYHIWISKLKLLKKYGLSCIVLITLTQDLFDMNIDDFLYILKNIDDTKAVDGIQFEHLVDYDSDLTNLHKNADEWLCKLHSKWNFNMENMIEHQLNDWKFNCSHIHTLTPSGNLKQGCPQFVTSTICSECYSCPLVKICKPCPLQQCCSFPKHLFELINTNINRE